MKKKATFILLLTLGIGWAAWTDHRDMHFMEHCTSHPNIQTVTCK